MNTDLQHTYNRIAEDWDRDPGSDDWWVEDTDYFLSSLPQGGSVLDVGCGAGVKAAYMLAKGFQITGIDFSEKFISIARRRTSSVRFALLPLEDLDAFEGEFDGVFAQVSLLHIPKVQAGDIIQKMAGKVRQKGFLYVAVKEAKSGKPEEAVIQEHDYGYDYERFFSHYTLLELESHFTNACLKVTWKDRKQFNNTVWLQIIGQK